MSKGQDQSAAEEARKAQVAAILKRLADGRTITAAQQRLLEEDSNPTPTPGERLYTVNELSVQLDRDPKTIKKALKRAGVMPAGTVKGHPGYRLADVEAALRGAPDTGKNELLTEQIRKLRIANDAAERRLVGREKKFSEAAAIAAEHRTLIFTILENEMPAEVQGHDMVACRVIGKRYADRLCSKLEQLAGVWT